MKIDLSLQDQDLLQVAIRDQVQATQGQIIQDLCNQTKLDYLLT